jgi:Alpha-L-rhamnosidase N-terminal domain.
MSENLLVHKPSHQFGSSLVAIPLEPVLLSWKVSSDHRALSQRGYELQVAQSEDFSGASSTGLKQSDQQIEVPVDLITPKPRATYFVRVRIETEMGLSQFSQPLRIEYSLTPEEISATSIRTNSLHSSPADIFRKEFELASKPTKARLYFSAQGVTQPFLNGQKLGSEYLMPGWTAYQERLNLIAFDVLPYLRGGSNAIGFELSDGWFRGKMGFMNKYDNYGEHSSVVGQLEIDLENGERVVVVTDNSWKSSESEVRFADIYDGSTIDLRKTQDGWSQPGFDESNWLSTIPSDMDLSLLRARYAAA